MINKADFTLLSKVVILCSNHVLAFCMGTFKTFTDALDS